MALIDWFLVVIAGQGLPSFQIVFTEHQVSCSVSQSSSTCRCPGAVTVATPPALPKLQSVLNWVVSTPFWKTKLCSTGFSVHVSWLRLRSSLPWEGTSTCINYFTESSLPSCKFLILLSIMQVSSWGSQVLTSGPPKAVSSSLTECERLRSDVPLGLICLTARQVEAPAPLSLWGFVGGQRWWHFSISQRCRSESWGSEITRAQLSLHWTLGTQLASKQDIPFRSLREEEQRWQPLFKMNEIQNLKI